MSSFWRLVCFGGFLLMLLAAFSDAPERSFSMPAAPDSSFSLQSYEWENRLLLVFAPSPDAADFREQMHAFEAAREGLMERDLLIIRIFDTGESQIGDQPISLENARQLREQFDVAPEQYRLILVGLDGTEKRREPAPISVESLFETIDAMPIRQREMRQQEAGDGGGRS